MTFNESREYCVAIHPKATVIHKNGKVFLFRKRYFCLDNLNIYNFMAPFWVNHPENNCFLLEPFGKLIKANCSSLANFICETKVSIYCHTVLIDRYLNSLKLSHDARQIGFLNRDSHVVIMR